MVALGAFALLVGVVVLLATVARPIAGVVGWPLRAFGTSGVLARENTMRNPRRTAVTASALVIGLALVGLTATFGASAKASVRKDTASGLLADYVVKADGFAGFSGDVAERLGELPELDAVVPIRVVDGAINGEVDTVGAVDPGAARGRRVARLRERRGRRARLGAGRGARGRRHRAPGGIAHR